MNLTPEQEAKIDPLLKEILPHADKDEILQVVVVLGEDQSTSSTTETLKPSAFQSRLEYRQALIEQRKQQLETGLEKWSSEKRLERDPIYQNFTTKLEIMLLSEVAYDGFIVDKLFFETQELVDKIKTFLARNLNAPQDLDGQAVLNAIAIQQGILVERLDNIYSFSHLTLLNYFCLWKIKLYPISNLSLIIIVLLSYYIFIFITSCYSVKIGLY
ncbi:hypothetical protein VB715_20740 [Crocosphaera sp. UHCC 0190]|uniref:hypothetical protein n=1 Tax=Crocosphaera sp. UHCC 0190 TaxID=3110246 RepID=UPI002B2138E3|nr:hypothetical protein [Crocosphaera sp. UHCC 0190]MEA5512205.1 hypothetical protein [Crocosphaera sp. UHCC 0190]